MNTITINCPDCGTVAQLDEQNEVKKGLFHAKFSCVNPKCSHKFMGEILLTHAPIPGQVNLANNQKPGIFMTDC
jgi:hypothetical protein